MRRRQFARAARRAKARYDRTVGNLMESVPGLGLPDSKELEFSPVLITPDNYQSILSSVGCAVSADELARLRIVAISAIQAYNRYCAKVAAAAAQLGIDKTERAATITTLRDELRQLESAGGNLRDFVHGIHMIASSAAAAQGLEFTEEDLVDVASVQQMLERNARTVSDIGTTGSAAIDTPSPAWVRAIVQVGPVLVSTLTAAGLLKLLTGGDLQTSVTGPMFPLAVGLGLGVTVPVLAGAYRLGWFTASSAEASDGRVHPIRTRTGLALGTAALIATALPVAGVDALGVAAFGQDLARSASRAGSQSDTSWWLPLIGFAFMGSATISKVWAGYCDCAERYQADQLSGAIVKSAAEIRKSCELIVEAVGLANIVEKRRAEVAELIQAKESQINSGEESGAEVPEEVKAAARNEQASWIGESNRFWRMVWDALPDVTVRADESNPRRKQPRSVWSRIFGRRRA